MNLNFIPLPISEEILGAYLEGNLTSEEAYQVEALMNKNEILSSFIDDLSYHKAELHNLVMDNEPLFNTDFELPEISKLTETIELPMADLIAYNEIPIMESFLIMQNEIFEHEESSYLSQDCTDNNIPLQELTSMPEDNINIIESKNYE